MILSIGMIVKNEEKYLDRCLKAMRPILDNVDSELIIADTGSTDSTVEIAKNYTDKVFTFEWINDFAAARNSTLACASGEWYMFLDADEIFESSYDIIKFFNSGEYNNYNSATFIVRSLYDSDDSSDFNAPRLTKKLPDTTFSGIVHESLNTFGDPVKNLSDIALHYGYLHNEVSHEEKFRRNSELLLKKYDLQGDTDPIIYLQLYECFYLHDRKKAEEFLEKGIDICAKRESPILIALYCHKAHLAYFDEHYNEALNITKQYFSLSKKIRPGIMSTDCEMHGFRASSLYHLGRYEEAIVAYSSFFDLYNSVSTGRIKTPDADMLVYYIASERNLPVAVYEFLSACVKSRDTASATYVLAEITFSRISFSAAHIKAITESIEYLITICTDTVECNALSARLKELS